MALKEEYFIITITVYILKEMLDRSKFLIYHFKQV